MDTYFIHSVLSHYPIDNHSSISTEQEEEKEFESPWFVSKSLEYQNIVDIKGATSNIATHELLDKIKQSYPSIFNDNRDHINRHQHEDSESEAEIIVKPKHKHLSESQISKISDLFNTGEKTRMEISQDLFVPYSTVWRVIREIKHDWDPTNQNNITKYSVSALKKMHEKLIDKYIEDRTTPYTTKNIQNFIKDINGAVL